MQKSSIKKISILGMVLVAASAVTAAVLPKNDTNESPRAGTDVLQASTGAAGQQTCVEAAGSACNATANSSTTAGSGSSTSGTAFTAASGNTSAS